MNKTIARKLNTGNWTLCIVNDKSGVVQRTIKEGFPCKEVVDLALAYLSLGIAEETAVRKAIFDYTRTPAGLAYAAEQAMTPVDKAAGYAISVDTTTHEYFVYSRKTKRGAKLMANVELTVMEVGEMTSVDVELDTSVDGGVRACVRQAIGKIHEEFVLKNPHVADAIRDKTSALVEAAEAKRVLEEAKAAHLQAVKEAEEALAAIQANA